MSKPKNEVRAIKYLRDDMIEYHSKSLHVSITITLFAIFLTSFLLQHKKDEVKGHLYKMAKEVKFFSFSLYYHRYFILNRKQGVFIVQKEEISKKFTKIPFSELLYIDSIVDHNTKKHAVSCEWKYSFSLQTKDRKFFLFSRTEEELFLWLTSFHRMAKV